LGFFFPIIGYERFPKTLKWFSYLTCMVPVLPEAFAPRNLNPNVPLHHIALAAANHLAA
jgi:hypothetical protein